VLLSPEQEAPSKLNERLTVIQKQPIFGDVGQHCRISARRGLDALFIFF